MRAFGAVGAAMIIILAGCAGQGGSQEEPEAYKGLTATDETGVIRGLVVNEFLVPVEGATIGLDPGGLQTVSDQDGAFGFSDLAPGVYFLTVSAAFHTTMQTSAQVEAGVERPRLTQVALQTLPKPEPRIETLETRFYMDGSTWVAGVGGVVFSTFLNPGTFRAFLDIAPNATWIQNELVWKAAQPLAERLQMQTWLYEPGSSSTFADEIVAGASPIIQAWKDPDQTVKAGHISFELFVQSGTYPVGFTISQEVELFTHVFQHFAPEEGWQFGRDGEHPLPP